MRENSTWDLIVAGAGSAGSALAVRTAERGRRVLLLEAGPDYRSAAGRWTGLWPARRSRPASPWAEDLNAPGARGVPPYPINSRDFRRVPTNDA